MKNEIGIIKTIFRYPVKSMAGTEISNSKMGFHGLEGDRRFAFQRVEDKSGFPFLTASKLPE
ncbi:MAG: MOSC N-terminal beta barrel domain-containing protein [Ignavibacteria bacterium]|nr:MOSC N-terminal beta barrel domain-containing protein [Ignavibacteria bacterium]